MNFDTPQYDLFAMPNSELLITHPSTKCEGGFCSVHNPSDHPLKDAPLNWREDRALMERICPHNIGHPDPDDLAFKKMVMHPTAYKNRAYESHGCDGCCTGSSFS